SWTSKLTENLLLAPASLSAGFAEKFVIPKAALAAGAAPARIANAATNASAPSRPCFPRPIGSLIRPMMMADMPTYEYRCDNGHTFEEVQSMSEDALTECTICGAPAQRILF